MKIKTVTDRKLPANVDPASIASQKKGSEGIGLNKESFNDSMRDNLNQGVDITE